VAIGSLAAGNPILWDSPQIMGMGKVSPQYFTEQRYKNKEQRYKNKIELPPLEGGPNLSIL
jgi:hypothetical protein